MVREREQDRVCGREGKEIERVQERGRKRR